MHEDRATSDATAGAPPQEAGSAQLPKGGSVRVLNGFYEGLELPVDRDWLVIGRGRGADVILADPTLSRAHVGIGFDGAAFFAQDLGSTNGTLVNGAPQTKTPLQGGDRIQIGRVELEVKLP